jgi:hypothetical protein
MSSVLSILDTAGNAANDRTTVVHDYLTKIKDRSSPLGTYSIDTAGNSSLTAFQFYRLHDGSLVLVQPARR